MSTQTQSDLDILRTTFNAWFTAFTTGDPEAFVALYDPDIYYANHGLMTMYETSAVYNHVKEIMDQTTVNVTFHEEVARTDENLGYIAGHFEMHITNKTNNETMVETGRLLLIFRKNSEGEWRVISEFDNRFGTTA